MKTSSLPRLPLQKRHHPLLKLLFQASSSGSMRRISELQSLPPLVEHFASLQSLDELFE
jgi:hypothetical protein